MAITLEQITKMNLQLQDIIEIKGNATERGEKVLGYYIITEKMKGLEKISINRYRDRTLHKYETIHYPLSEIEEIKILEYKK